MTWTDIQSANEQIKTTDIKGKSYAEVPERIKAFRSICPDGAIVTELLSDIDGICTMKTTVLDGEGRILGVGHAQEKEGGTFINKTSYIENCETSAVGRALGMVGIGLSSSVASYEEVANAISNQGAVVNCSDCDKEIVDAYKKDGSLWSASNVVAYSTKRFKRPLCPDCQRAAFGKEKEEEVSHA